MTYTPQQIAHLVQAVADGCGWRYYSCNSRYSVWRPGSTLYQLLSMLAVTSHKIELIAESWDWPEERRVGKRGWFLYGTDWIRGISGIDSEFIVAINPAEPDQSPPDDWSPEKYSRVLE